MKIIKILKKITVLCILAITISFYGIYDYYKEDYVNFVLEPYFEVEEINYAEIERVYLFFDYPIFGSFDEIFNFTTDVVRAKVLDVRTEQINTLVPRELRSTYPYTANLYDDREYFYEIFSIYSIRILETFKGNTAKNDVVELAITGGQFENLNIVSLSHTHLEVDDDLILFLRESILVENRFFQSSISQSAYRIVESANGDLMLGLGELNFESLNENNPLTLTLEDLQRISEDIN